MFKYYFRILKKMKPTLIEVKTTSDISEEVMQHLRENLDLPDAEEEIILYVSGIMNIAVTESTNPWTKAINGRYNIITINPPAGVSFGTIIFDGEKFIPKLNDKGYKSVTTYRMDGTYTFNEFH